VGMSIQDTVSRVVAASGEGSRGRS
jgi:hypothetical protein